MRMRSLLFAPGNQARKVEKAFALPADMICLDLEDAVAVREKQSARDAISALLKSGRYRPFFVRLNHMDSNDCFDDLDAVVQPGLAGVILPKVESATGLLTIDWLLRQLERKRGLAERSLEIMPVIETARGLVRLQEICEAQANVRRLNFGSWDFTLDAGITYDPADETSIADARQRVVLHSRSAGLEAPIDTSYPVIGDIDGLRRSCIRSRVMGFGGKACLHPGQVEPVNEAFSISAEDLARARQIVAEFEKAEAAGSAAIRVAGAFVDYPIYRKAKALVDREDAAQERERL